MFNFFKNNFKTNKSDTEIEINRTLIESGIEFKINKIENDEKIYVSRTTPKANCVTFTFH